jgi:hypothetical protein
MTSAFFGWASLSKYALFIKCWFSFQGLEGLVADAARKQRDHDAAQQVKTKKMFLVICDWAKLLRTHLFTRKKISDWLIGNILHYISRFVRLSAT